MMLVIIDFFLVFVNPTAQMLGVFLLLFVLLIRSLRLVMFCLCCTTHVGNNSFCEDMFASASTKASLIYLKLGRNNSRVFLVVSSLESPSKILSLEKRFAL